MDLKLGKQSNHSPFLVLTVSCLVFILSFSPCDVFAVQQVNTKYFTILYDEDGEYTAGEIAKFCDEVYEKLLARYKSFNDDPRVLCVVNDAVDLASGYAIYYQNTITIYATNMDYELRGQTNWLKNVFVHEMTHMVSLKKAAKGPFNFVSLGGGKFNNNPDISVDVAFYHLSQPAWFSEGSAQIGAENYGSECWDSHREMVLRSAWMENSLLSMDAMSVLPGQTGMDGEMVYNQGYSLVKYIKDTYGYDKLVELNNSGGYINFDPTVKCVLGVGVNKLYDAWRAHLDQTYAPFKGRTFVEGDKVKDTGSSDYYPAVSPDGKYLAWLSNRGKDYAITDLMLMDFSTGQTKKIVEEVDYRVSWSHDSTKLVYVKRPPKSPRFYDIYIYDVTTGKEQRISKNMRARDPNFSTSDSLIVFIQNSGGNNAIALMNSDGTGLRYLTSTHDGTQFYTPSFSPDGSKIVFSLYKQNMDRDIGYIASEGRTYRYTWELADSTSGYSDSTSFGKNCGFTVLLGSKSDERDPVFLPDGSGLVYVSNRTSVFNIYRLDMKTSRVTRLTDVYGGAFFPSSGNGKNVFYSGYKARDFSIYRIGLDSVVETGETVIEERDYLKQPKAFDLSKHFDVETYRQKRIINAIVPTLFIGPSFIGSRFGLNVIDVGATTYISDLLGYDALILSGSVGKNLKEDVGLNSNFEIYYERAMVPVTSSKYTHAPRLYFNASRTVINNYLNRLEATGDSVDYRDMPDLGYENVLYDGHWLFIVDDEYRDEFRRYRLGIYIPLAKRHHLSMEAGYRQYYESLKRHWILKDFSNYFLNGSNITGQVPYAYKTQTADTKYFTDMEYFQSREFGVNYLYIKRVPAADDDISPQGTSVFLQFKHFRTAVTDSLVYQPWFYVLGEYNPDPLLDFLRPSMRDTDFNEYMVLFQDDRQPPIVRRFRHTFNALVFAAYKDIYLMDYRKGEGDGYNWPLKYYLGGGNVMTGYPYFAFWGSKVLYSRFGYTFPIRSYIAENYCGIHFQHVYGHVFFEAGRTWNFRRASIDRLKEGAFKRDVGFELRFSLVAFYRLTTLAYVRVSWPLDDMGGSPYKNDVRRYYFGLRM